MRRSVCLTAALLLTAGCGPGVRVGGERDAGFDGQGGGSGGNGGAAGGGGGAGGTAGGGGGSGGGSGGADAGSDLVVSWEDGGPGCGSMTTPVPYSPKTPDVIISFDKSGSMYKSFGTGTRLSTERAILNPLVSMYEAKIRWGYEEFPLLNNGCGATCCVDKVTVPPAFMNAAAMTAAINGGDAGSRVNTPTELALAEVRRFYEGFVDGVTERYVLLSTDGQPAGCGSGEGTRAVDEVKRLAAMGIKTIVLGVSDEASGSVLEQMAVAGGVPRAGGPPSYYPATDPASLQMYLETIISGIAKPSCAIELTMAPPDASRVAVFFDGKQIPWDPTHVDGWDYAPGSTTKILVYGMSCTNLEGFKVMTIDVRFGCPPCGGTVGC